MSRNNIFLSILLIICMLVGCTKNDVNQNEGKVSDTNETVLSERSDDEYEVLLKERDTYKEESEKNKSELGQVKQSLEKVQAEYTAYKDKMKKYENLDEAEAEARQIEAQRIIDEENLKKAAAEEEAKRLEEEKKKKGYETGITYEQLARTPDDYAFEKVKFAGKVLQVLESDDEVHMRLAVDGDYNKVIYVVYEPSIVSVRILENDNVTMYGWFYELYTYESTLGASITLPLVMADKIEFTDGVTSVDAVGNEVSISSKDYIAINEAEIINSLQVTEYRKDSSWYYYTYFLVDNHTELDLKISIDVSYYDKNNNLVGIDSDYVPCVEKGTTAYIKCSTDEPYDHYEYVLSVEAPDDFYQAATTSISYEVSETSKKVIITAQNNSTEKLSAQAYVLFFDAKGKLVDTEEIYLHDDDFEIKPGKKISKEAKTYETYKSYKIIIYAVKTKY